MREIDHLMSRKFVCDKCKHRGGTVKRMALTGTGISRFFNVQHHHYAYVSCPNCGFTEIYDLRVLEGKDNLGTFIDILFSG